MSILVWAALYYPHNPPTAAPLKAEAAAVEAQQADLPPDSPEYVAAGQRLQQLEHAINGEYQRHSILGPLGHWIEPAVRPLGWDWRIGCAVLASFPAREVVVATLGVIYPMSDADAGGEEHDTEQIGQQSAPARGTAAASPCSPSRWRCRSWSSSRCAPSARRRWP